MAEHQRRGYRRWPRRILTLFVLWMIGGAACPAAFRTRNFLGKAEGVVPQETVSTADAGHAIRGAGVKRVQRTSGWTRTMNSAAGGVRGFLSVCRAVHVRSPFTLAEKI